MKKILLVIGREYTTRVRKASFWILSIVVPLMLAVIYAIPIFIATNSVPHINVMVVDETGIFLHEFNDNATVSYIPAGGVDYAQKQLSEVDSIDAVLFIPNRASTIPTDAFLYYHTDEPTIEAQRDIDNQLQNILRNNMLYDIYHISPDDYASIASTTIRMHGMDLETGRDGYMEVKMILGMVLAMIIMLAIVLCTSQVMRGVVEEKTSRIVEVIICSVKPFQLMMGKVIGIGLVGLTQFALWTMLSTAALIGLRASNSEIFAQAEQQANITQVATKGTDATMQMQGLGQEGMASELMQGITSIDFGTILPLFLFFFVVGYLLYASLFAAAGAISDPDTSEQQITLPLMIPILLPMLLMPAMINEPSGSIATWLSIIPFTSPIAMMMRIPYGVPLWQTILSIVLLIAFVPLCTWIAARIYRSALLRYGKTRISDIVKWMRR